MRHSVRLLAAGIAGTTLLAGSVSLRGRVRARPHAAPGVTPTQVKVGAIVSQSGPVAADFKPYLSGVRAYFDYSTLSARSTAVRSTSRGHLTTPRDPSTNITDARTLVTADHAFAVVGVSVPFFNGSSYLKSQNMPTFGYATGPQWSRNKGFFADYGSVLNYNSSVPFFAYVAKKTKSTKVAVVALNYQSSHDECKGALTGLQKYKVPIAYSNINEPITNSWGSEALKMFNAHVNMVISCMDVNSNVGLSKQLKNYGLKPVQLWLDGYDRSILKAQGQFMANTYFMLQHVPFEAATQYPTAFKGLNLYFAQMAKYGFSADEFSDVALAGWESANTFTMGLRAAGKNPTQASLVDGDQQDQEGHRGPCRWRDRTDELDDRAHLQHVTSVRGVRRDAEHVDGVAVVQARVQRRRAPLALLPAHGNCQPEQARQATDRDTRGLASRPWASSSATPFQASHQGVRSPSSPSGSCSPTAQQASSTSRSAPRPTPQASSTPSSTPQGWTEAGPRSWWSWSSPRCSAHCWTSGCSRESHRAT